MPRKTHCLRGHPRTPANVDGGSMCRTCRNDRKRARRAQDTRPKDPRKVKAGHAAYAAKMARKAAAAPAPRVALVDDPAIQLYRAEKARRQERAA